MRGLRAVEHFWGLGFERVAVAEPSIEGFAVIKREPTS